MSFSLQLPTSIGLSLSPSVPSYVKETIVAGLHFLSFVSFFFLLFLFLLLLLLLLFLLLLFFFVSCSPDRVYIWQIGSEPFVPSLLSICQSLTRRNKAEEEDEEGGGSEAMDMGRMV